MADPRTAELAPERVSWTCPLGLRFFDVATGMLVVDGLKVTATRTEVVAPVVTSQLTPSGVHAFHRLPGLPSVDPPDRPDPWVPPPTTHEYRIEVADAFQRFLPCTFVVEAPFRGLDSPVILASPPYSNPRGIPLFSAASRSAPPGFVIARAELREFAGSAPAAWAMVEVRYLSAGKNIVAQGMADRRGAMVVMFPLPEGPRRGFGFSPPASDRPADCDVELAFFHDASPPEVFSDYGRRLSQPLVHAFREGSPGLLLDRATLAFGTDNHLSTLELAVA